MAGGAALLPSGRVARWLLSRLAPADFSVAAQEFSGNALTGFTLTDVRLSRPGIEAQAKRVFIRLSWTGLLRRRLSVERLTIEAPRVRWSAAPAEAPRPAGRWKIDVQRFLVNAGALEWRYENRARFATFAARGHYQGGLLEIEEAEGRLSGLQFSARGRAGPQGGDVEVILSGAAAGRVRLTSDAARWRWLSSGRWRGASWGSAGAWEGGRWRGWAELRGLKTGGRRAPVTARLEASGIGVSKAAAARGTWWAREQGGLRVAGSTTLSDGAVSWRAHVSSGAVGVLRGSVDLASRRFDARVRLAENASQLEASARGTPGSHAVAVSLSAGALAASAAGSGSWRGGAWLARWESLRVLRPRQVWAAEPFRTRAAKGSLRVEGLALTDGAATLAVSAERRREGWARLDASLERFDPEPWAAAGVWRSPLRGKLGARARLSGNLHSPSGALEAWLEDGSYGGVELGRLDFAARLDGRIARLDRLDWTLRQGRARVTGTAPLVIGGPAPADFKFVIEARGLEAGALAGRLRAVTLSAPVLDADLSVRREGGAIRLEGGGSVGLTGGAVPAAGLMFGPSRIDFEGDGPRLRVTSGELAPRGRGAQARLSGTAGPEGPALKLTGERLRFDTGRGLKGEGDAAVDIGGQWGSPRVTGAAVVRHADLMPLGRSEKRRIERAAAAPRRPSATAVDLRFHFDRDVWYKEKATSIEMKGDVRLRKAPFEPTRLQGLIETVRGAYVYFGRVFEVERGSLKLAGETPRDALVSARARWVDPVSRTRVFLDLSGTLREPRMTLSSEPQMEERDVFSFLVFGRPLYEAGARDSRSPGGPEEAARIISDYIAQGVRRYLPPQLALDVFRVGVQQGRPDVTVGRYLTRRLFVSYGQTLGEEGEKRLDTAYTLSPHWSVEAQNTNQGRNVVDLLFNFGFR